MTYKQMTIFHGVIFLILNKQWRGIQDYVEFFFPFQLEDFKIRRSIFSYFGIHILLWVDYA